MARSFNAWVGISLFAHGAAFALATWGVSSHAPAPTADAAPAQPTLTGDTLEVPGLEAISEDAVDLDNEPVPVAPAEATEGEAPRPKTPRAKSKLVVHGAPASASAANEPGGDGDPARFGAVGERGSVDVATAFTRGFPQAASADPIWMKAAFGSAGSVDVVLSIDGAGHLVEARLGAGGTPALRQALARTIALIRGRTFTTKSKNGTTRLRVVGVVSADAVRNEARGGDVFAIGGSYAKNAGTAFFSLAVGRRIDVTVTDR